MQKITPCLLSPISLHLADTRAPSDVPATVLPAIAIPTEEVGLKHALAEFSLPIVLPGESSMVLQNGGFRLSLPLWAPNPVVALS